MPSIINGHFLKSVIVTSVIVILFGIFVMEHSKFKLSDEYGLVPEGFILPKGCEIRIDMQSGETWARKRKFQSPNAPILIKEVANNDTPSASSSNASNNQLKGVPEYKNITKNRIISRLSPESLDKLDLALNSLEFEESWEYLEEEAPAIEFGLAILESKSFKILRNELISLNSRAVGLIATALQNNSLAIEKFVQLNVHSGEITEILKNEFLEVSILKKVLRILESLQNDKEFMKLVLKDVMRHSESHELDERYNEFIISIQ